MSLQSFWRDSYFSNNISDKGKIPWAGCKNRTRYWQYINILKKIFPASGVGFSGLCKYWRFVCHNFVNLFFALKLEIKNSKKVFVKIYMILIFDFRNREIVKNRVRFHEKFRFKIFNLDFLLLTFTF